MKRKNNFSLIELLVVVAIIAILAAILLPALAKAKETSRRAVCLSNMKQIGYALIMYNDDHREIPNANPVIRPTNGMDSTYDVSKKEAYGVAFLIEQNYIPGAQVMYCPSWKHPWNQYDTVDIPGDDPWFGAGQMGGWPAPGSTGPSRHRAFSYHYRATYDNGSGGFSAPSMNDAPSTTALMTDHFTRREVLYGFKYGHVDAYATLYIDGHSSLVFDHGASYMLEKMAHSHSEDFHKCNKYTNGNWTLQETVWREFFDED